MAEGSDKTGHKTIDAFGVDQVRQIFAGKDHDEVNRTFNEAQKAFEALSDLLIHAPHLRDGRLSTGNIDYAAFRIETLSLIFEIALHTLRAHAKNPDQAYATFLERLGTEVGITFARDLMGRIEKHQLILAFPELRKLIDLWVSFENDTGAGKTEILKGTDDIISIRLSRNPLRRIESEKHSHCGFYSNYLVALVNELIKVRARLFREKVKDSNMTAATVVRVVERPDAQDECVFTLELRKEKLVQSFDLLTEAFHEFYRVTEGHDYSSCMTKIRGAIVRAQMEALGLADERAPPGIHLVYKRLISPGAFKDLDETYQRTSDVIHAETKPKTPVDSKQAWRMLLGARRGIYAIEVLELEPAQLERLRSKVKVLGKLSPMEKLVSDSTELSPAEKKKFKDLITEIRNNDVLPEEHQRSFAEMLKKAGPKTLEFAQSVITEVVSAAIKKQLGLD